MAEDKQLSGPDLKLGVELDKLVENEPLLGHYDGDAVILVRQGDHVFAVAGTCTHYSGPRAEGLLVGKPLQRGGKRLQATRRGDRAP
jgi:apoptosis-inducing factor 3